MKTLKKLVSHTDIPKKKSKLHPLTIEDKIINKYKVKSGTSLEYWEDHGWITKQSPYGWIQWFLKFYNGVRSYDDERQIKRWLGVAGPNGRFRKRLINEIKKTVSYTHLTLPTNREV